MALHPTSFDAKKPHPGHEGRLALVMIPSILARQIYLVTAKIRKEKTEKYKKGAKERKRKEKQKRKRKRKRKRK